MNNRKQVIVITDGDEYARKTMDYLAPLFGGTCLSHLSDNPTKASSKQVMEAVKSAPSDLVFVLVDDAGWHGIGAGEHILIDMYKDSTIKIIGAIAVASHTKNLEWTRFTFAIDNEGNLTANGVDKEGIPIEDVGRINGDTVYALDQVDLPIVVAIGDIGKMYGRDDIKKGSPITRKAIELILERGGNDE